MLMACHSQSYTELNGTWVLNSPYYKATYLIEDNDAEQKCEVIKYDDGTSKFQRDLNAPFFLFEKIKFKDGDFHAVDCASGATMKADKFVLTPISEDTLQVTSYIDHHPLIENWVRIKN